MKTTNRICAFTLALALTAGCALGASAYTEDDILRQASALTQATEDAPIYLPVKPAEGEIVSYHDWDTVYGVAVLCTDATQLEGMKIGEYTLTLDQQATADYVLPVGSYESVLTQIRANAANKDDYAIAWELPNGQPANLGEVYVLPSTAPDFMRALCKETRLQPLGLLSIHWHQPTLFTIEATIAVRAEAGAVLDDAVLTDAARIQLSAITSGFGCAKDRVYFRFLDTSLTLEQVAAACERLEGCAGVTDAWLDGTYPPSFEYAVTNGASVRAFVDYHLGDLNLDGVVNANDATLALQEYVAQLTGATLLTAGPPLTPLGF